MKAEEQGKGKKKILMKADMNPFLWDTKNVKGGSYKGMGHVIHALWW